MASKRNMVSFDRPKLERLKKAKAKAEKEGRDTFIFDGDEYVVIVAGRSCSKI